MKKATALLACFTATLSCVMLRASPSDENQSVKMQLRVFCIPPIQTVTKTVPSEGPGIKGMMYGGNVTASFPDGVVLLNIDSDQKYDDLMQIIKDRVIFPCPEVVGILPAAVHEFEFDPIKMSPHRFEVHEEIFHRGISYGKYWLQIIPVTLADSGIIMRIRFSTRTPGEQEALAKDLSFKKELLDQTLGIGLNQTLLIGFPSNEGGQRGTVYWIVLSPKILPSQ